MHIGHIISSICNDYPPIYIYLGAVFTHVFSPYNKNHKGSKPFLITVLKDKSDVFYSRMDLLILPIMALIFGYVAIHPTTIQAAMTTGLTCNVTLFTIIKKSNK